MYIRACTFIYLFLYFSTHVLRAWQYLAAYLEVLGSIPGATRYSEQQLVWNGVHSALERINEELLERKIAALV
jgi:hypothetical protein